MWLAEQGKETRPDAAPSQYYRVELGLSRANIGKVQEEKAQVFEQFCR